MKKIALLVFPLSAFLLTFASPLWAVPIINGNPWAFTENFGPNTAGFTEGHSFHVGAIVQDPLGVPGNISSAYAENDVAGQPDYSLPYQDIGPINEGLYEVVTAYTGQSGQWHISVVNDQGESASASTNILDDVHVIPLATNLTVAGSLLAPTITWDPVFFDHDNDSSTPDVEVDDYRVRLLNDAYDQFFRSDSLATNSFTVPLGLIVPGETFIRLVARDFDVDGALENRSSTFTQFTAPAPVPEPSTLFLIGSGLVGIIGARRKLKKK